MVINLGDWTCMVWPSFVHVSTVSYNRRVLPLVGLKYCRIEFVGELCPAATLTDLPTMAGSNKTQSKTLPALRYALSISFYSSLPCSIFCIIIILEYDMLTCLFIVYWYLIDFPRWEFMQGKKEKKNAFDQNKKERKHDLDQEKNEVTKISTKEKVLRFSFFFLYRFPPHSKLITPTIIS